MTEATFKNGNFGELRSVHEWVFYMQTKRGHKGKSLHPEYVKIQVNLLKQLCQRFQKHPDRLTVREANECFLAMEKDQSYEHWEGTTKVKGQDTCCFRRAVKDFLKANGVKGWEQIGVGKPSGYGHYKNLWAEPTIVKQMLDWTTQQSFEIGTVDWLMYVTGIRLGENTKLPHGALGAQIEDFKRTPEWDFITVREKFREIYTFQFIKKVGDMVAKVIGTRETGPIFNIPEGPKTVSKINRLALKKFLPELEPTIEMPSHFYRHMCAQHLRKLTLGNSGLCAEMMHCSKQSFDESYGGVTTEEVEAGKLKYLPMLGA